MKARASGEDLAQHGGRLCSARALHPDAPKPWIDLSTGINPRPYPAPRATLSARARLPSPQQLRALEATAARAFGVDDPQRIAATPGSEPALRLMPYALPSEQAIIVGPTYSSHADAWQGQFVQATPHSLRPRAREGGPMSEATASCRAQFAAAAAVRSLPQAHDVSARTALIFVNPNNPDGAVIPRDHVLTSHDEMAARAGFLVIDEAFADVDPACSVAAVAGNERYPRLVVLRSFGKFYGLAGVRLGFVIAAPAIIERFRALFGDWPVAADAIAAGLAAYADAPWAERTRARLRTAASRLDAVLERNGFTLIGGTSLFRLARSDAARARFEQLLRAGILVRPFDHDPTSLRFGLPCGAVAWRRLTEALRF